MKYTLTFFSFFLFGYSTLCAQKHHKRFANIDVQHYKFEISLSDDNDRIEAKTEIDILFKQEISELKLDLISYKKNGKGMVVHAVTETGDSLNYRHVQDKLIIEIDKSLMNEVRSYVIHYSGIPADGLYISKNKYGQRSFFGDNYPDRGQHWLPLVDHPSDKATLEWIITAPSTYQTIGNGQLKQITNLSNGRNMTHWKMNFPISTKLMVFASSKFAVEHHHHPCNIPISNWVYTEERAAGFNDFENTSEILDFYTSQIGSYPFEKLANVQSKTKFGGMENAGNIFYDENRINGKGLIEDLVAHEIAHQWFGNSATELEWHHLWLSEGFATYLTDLYWEHKYGRPFFVERLIAERSRYLKFSRRKSTPVVDTTEHNYLKLLTPNAYQKGAWILHMLRSEVGDEIFWDGIRSYYDQYKYQNALSVDFQNVMEDISGLDLSVFFNQWLNFRGHPKLRVYWDLERDNHILIDITQKQKTYVFQFPLEIKLNYVNGESEVIKVVVDKIQQRKEIQISHQVTSIELDPETVLLFELESLSKRK